MEFIACLGAVRFELMASKIITHAIMGELVTAYCDSSMAGIFAEHFLYDYGLHTLARRATG